MIRELYPNLLPENYIVTSEATTRYNSVAFAIYADDTADCCWWPVPYGEDEYPWPAEREETLESFTKVFQSVGYEICNTDQPEIGFKKVAIYVNSEGKPTHVAWQCFKSSENQWVWKSKVGSVEDIEHEEVNALNPGFGSVARILRREQQ